MSGLANGKRPSCRKMDIFWFSFWQACVTVGVSLILGGGFAVLEHSRRTPAAKWFVALCALPVFLPTLVVAVGCISVWGNAGYVNAFLGWAGLPQFSFLYSARGIIAGHVFYNAPLVYLLVRLRLSTMHIALEDAARLSGASAWRAFVDVSWPRLKSTVLGACTLVFLYAFLSFGLPLVLGGVRYRTVEVAIFRAAQELDVSGALILAGLQFVFLTCVVLLGMRSLSAISEQQHQQVVRGRHSDWLVSLARVIVATFLLSPIVAVIVNAFRVRSRGAEHWGSENVEALFRADALQAWLLTLGIAALCATLVLVVALPLVWRFEGRVTKPLLLLLAISPVTVSVMLRLSVGASQAALIVIMALCVLPVITLVLANHWSARPRHLLDTARLLGASPQALRRLTLGFQRPAIAQGVILVAAFVLSDIAIASVLAPHGEPTLMKLSYQLLGSYHFHVAAAGMSLSLFTISLVALVIYLLSSPYVTRRF